MAANALKLARAPAKAAKAAKASCPLDPTLATLAALAGPHACFQLPALAALAALAAPHAKSGNFTDDQIEFEERAAILEFLGGFPRAEAERRAHKELQQ